MKILIIGNAERYEKFRPEDPVYETSEKIFVPRGASDRDILSAGADAEVILADAISTVSAAVIGQMPNLRLIHSEGVAFNRIDTEAAKQRGIPVCNNKGGNAAAVAEQAVLLMLGVLRSVISGHEAVLDGRQIETKERLMVEGITDLADCRVGLIGFGDIARAVAERLYPFGCRCYYNARSRHTPEEEARCHAEYLPLDDLLSGCDIISLHMAVTPQTREMINAETIARMKNGAILINTARGELVDNAALCAAIRSGRIAAAGLDTVSPEPVQKDNPVVLLAAERPGSILLSPHIGGVTTGSFRRMHAHLWKNVARVERGEQPDCIVN